MYNKSIRKRNPLPILLLIISVAAVAVFVLSKISQPPAPKPAADIPEPPQQFTFNYSYSGWLKYFNSTLGLDMLYPPQFKNYQSGSLSSKITLGGKGGAVICINISNCLAGNISQFEIGSASIGWSDLKIPPTFIHLQGYMFDSNTYFVRTTSGEYVPLDDPNVHEIDLPDSEKALVIPGQAGSGAGTLYPQSGWIGAIINTGFPDYPGLVVLMQLKSDLTPPVFEYILKSFSFPFKHNFPADADVLDDPTPPRFYDQSLKSDMAAVAKIINCRYRIDGRYPNYYYPDQACGKSKTITNGVNQKPYYYSATSDGQGFVIKAKMSTGQIYSVTEAEFPPPITPTPTPSQP